MNSVAAMLIVPVTTPLTVQHLVLDKNRRPWKLIDSVRAVVRRCKNPLCWGSSLVYHSNTLLIIVNLLRQLDVSEVVL